MAVWFSFFTDHTSGTLFGPNHSCPAPSFQPKRLFYGMHSRAPH